MKRYGAIGHWRGNENVTFVANTNNDLKSFRDDLGGNDFIPWMIITEKTMKEIAKDEDVWEMVKRKVTNYRKWDIVNEYIAQCFDIMEERFYVLV